MTTVAYKEGILASDGRSTYHDTIECENTQKIFKVENGWIGFAGTLCHFEVLLKHLKDNSVYIRDDVDIYAIFVNAKRQVFSIEIYQNSVHYVRVSDVYAVGSGAMYALGAMAAGATAEQAIKIASKYDIGTNNRVKKVTIK
jgi:ATP-dependent protease HslVU (ClpYQ) peptidase subunit